MFLKNSTNPIACADFKHAALSPDSVIIYRGSCCVFDKISTIIEKIYSHQRTAYCTLRSATYQLFQLLLHYHSRKLPHALLWYWTAAYSSYVSRQTLSTTQTQPCVTECVVTLKTRIESSWRAENMQVTGQPAATLIWEYLRNWISIIRNLSPNCHVFSCIPLLHSPALAFLRPAQH
jgi:hypothetical protein